MKSHQSSKSDAIPSSTQGVHRSLLEAALIVFNRMGYGGTTIAEIAREAGMTKQRVTYHYSDADEILYELAEIWSQTGQRVTLEHLASGQFSSPVDKIVGMATALFRWIEIYPSLATLTPVLLQAVKNNEKIAKSLSNTFETGIARIFDFLSITSKEIKTKKKEDLKFIAQGTHSIMVGMALYAIAREDFSHIKEQQTLTADTIRFFLTNSIASTKR